MAVLRLVDVSVEIGERRLFADVRAGLEAGERVALVGPNGSGKSTLLAIAAGVRTPSAGSVVRASGLRVGYLPQDPVVADGTSVWEVARRSDGGETVRLEARLRALEPRLDEAPELLEEYGETLARYEHRGGYGWDARVREHLRGVGLGEPTYARPPATLSGGQRMRLALACLLLGEPDLLLLDEPTNHLDLDAIRWLEESLLRTRGAILFVSHDRAFLRRLATATWGFVETGFLALPMGYDAFRAESRRRLEELDARYAAAQAERQRLAAFVQKWSAGTRARQAKDREHKLGRLHAERPPARRGRLRLRFGPAAGRKRRGLVLERVGFAFGPGVEPLWRDLDLVLEQGARIGILGANGSGKSTLLRVLAGELRPTAGRVLWSDDSRVGILHQEVEVAGESVLDALLRLSGMTRFEAHRRLGEGLFSPDQLTTPLSALSGGERTRLGLIALTARGTNVLLLDEPTNHLDVEGQEALEDALAAFAGTLVVVSHDRAFLAATTDRWLVLRPGERPSLVATGDTLGAGLPPAQSALPAGPKARPAPGAGRSRPVAAAEGRRPNVRALRRELEVLEAEVARDEAALAALERLFAGPYTPEQGARRHDYDALRTRLGAAYARWDALAEALEYAEGGGRAPG